MTHTGTSLSHLKDEEDVVVTYTELHFLLQVLQEKIKNKEALLPVEYEIWQKHGTNLEIISGLSEKEQEIAERYSIPIAEETPGIIMKPGYIEEEASEAKSGLETIKEESEK